MIKTTRLAAVAIGMLSMLTTGIAQAENLLEIYQQARLNDPAIREAEANMRAQSEAQPQAMAALLPQVNAQVGWTETSTDGTTVPNNFLVNEIPIQQEGSSTNASLNLSQTLFNVDQWRQLKRAEKDVLRAAVDYQVAQQELIVRVGQAYFDVLAAQDTLASEQAAKEAIGRQLEQANRRFEVGLIAITDVKESQAAYDDSVALEIAAQRALATAKEGLREITGVYPQVLATPAEEFPLIPPDPQVEQEWVDVSLKQNLRLQSAEIGVDITRESIRIAEGGHWPTLGFDLSLGRRDNTNKNFLAGTPPFDPVDPPNVGNTSLDTVSAGINFRLPIYSGGGVSSRVQQQVYLHRAARENYERVARQTERETRDAYLGVIAEIARVQALARSEESNITALEATEAGYDVGTRTTVDVLNARQSLFLAQTQYARSKYDYLINLLRLRQAAGTLSGRDVKTLNGWLIAEKELQSSPGRGSAPDVTMNPGTPTTGGALELEEMRKADEKAAD